MEKVFTLIPHPANPDTLPGLTVTVEFFYFYISKEVEVDFRVQFNKMELINWPDEANKPERKDELWLSTCFECFFGHQSKSYREWNFSPSKEWQCYEFESYRKSKKPIEAKVKTPKIRITKENDWGLKIFLQEELPFHHINLTSIIEDKFKNRHYFAISHPDIERPDFHLIEYWENYASPNY